MNIIKQLELDLGPLTQNISQTPTPTPEKELGLTNVGKNTWNTSEEVKKSVEPLFDETGRRILARRPRLEKDYQKELVFYLVKACEYLPWRFYVEFRIMFHGQQRFIDLVLKTERSQHLLIELKKGTITVEIIKEILDRNYLEAYKKQAKNTKYPFLYIIGQQVTQEAKDYAEFLTQEWKQQFKRYKYKPQILVRTYTELMEFLDSQLSQTEINNFEFIRLQRDCPLLYESILPLL